MILPQELTSNRIYDGFAPHYGYDVNANVAARLKYDLALKYIKPNDEVLDIGCANGIHIRPLAAKCRRIVGVDINDVMLGLAQKILTEDGITNASVERRSAADLGFADASFDLVYSFATLTLVPEIKKALQEMVRVLRSGGLALLDLSGWWNLSHAYWSRYFRQHGHFGQNGFSYREGTMLLQSVGFVGDRKPRRRVPRPMALHPRSSLVQMAG